MPRGYCINDLRDACHALSLIKVLISAIFVLENIFSNLEMTLMRKGDAIISMIRIIMKIVPTDGLNLRDSMNIRIRVSRRDSAPPLLIVRKTDPTRISVIAVYIILRSLDFASPDNIIQV